MSQPCDSKTLTGACPGCDRAMHHRVGKRGSRAKCEHGHVVHDYGNMCVSCTSREEARKRGVKPRPRRGVGTIAYCTHDEGEFCNCEGAA